MNYHDHFDHLGHQFDADQPWRLADLLRVAAAIALVVGAIAIRWA